MSVCAQELRTSRSRRRVSQLELALRAGTTQRHVSFIEGGRSVPGRSMVVRLAESLDVPLRERNALLLAAGYAPAYPETRYDDPELAPVREALERVLNGHLPYPAVIIDRVATLVSANAAFAVVTAGVAEHLLTEPVNIARLLLHPEGVAPRILNLDECRLACRRPRARRGAPQRRRAAQRAARRGRVLRERPSADGGTGAPRVRRPAAAAP
jgi:transcriptional regulator with XRE-family HTH domain